MLAEIADFRWHVFSKGYECIDCDMGGQSLRIVVPKWFDEDADEEESLVARHPLEEVPGLYRQFAALELTEQAILLFANTWGPLENAHELEPDEIEERMVAWKGDPTESWFTQIRRMKALVELWDALQGKTEKKLSELIDIEKSECVWSWDVEVGFKDYPALKWFFTFAERDWPGFSDLLETGGTRELARACLIDLVNESLWGSCSPWISVGENLDDVTICLTPHDLNAAMWLQFVQEILGEKSLKQCLYCKRYFEVSPEINERRQRSDKKYCSPKCRGAAFRERAEKVPPASNES